MLIYFLINKMDKEDKMSKAMWQKIYISPAVKYLTDTYAYEA